MRYYVLLVLVPCAAYAAASLVATLVSAVTWPWVRRRVEGMTPSRRAHALAAVRLAPVAAGLAFTAVLTGAFLRFEPLDTTETPGLFLTAAASLTFVLTGIGFARAARAILASARCRRLLQLAGNRIVRHDGTPVWLLDTPYPVAAVTGLFRPRLLLSARIIEECTASELDAIVRHERAHVRRGDNLARAAILYLPNPLALTPAGREMQHAWAAAAEEAADDDAAGDAVDERTVLASALLRVARMATAPPPDWVPALTFYEGSNLENRVRRLLDGRHRRNGVPVGGVLLSLLLLAGCGFALTDGAARHVHVWMEVAVQHVP
ncbi:MAG TPA: M56 family metallopeptidase [Vicinamibacterales bacterium]